MIEAMEKHAVICSECRERLRLWNEISAAACALRRNWESPDLWPRIHLALARESSRRDRGFLWKIHLLHQFLSERWRGFAVGFAVLVITVSGAWIFWRNFQAPPIAEWVPETERRLLTEQALREIESAETAYIQSIDKLSGLVDPKLQQATSPLLISYREKLMIIDSAIGELRATIERNRFNAHLRQELLSIYQEKQRTLQELMRGDKNVTQ